MAPEHLMDGVAPLLFADPLNARYVLNNQFVQPSDIFALSSAANKTFATSNGGVGIAGANELRIDHSSGVPEILYEGSGVNGIRNPRMEGAVLGTIGSGGQFPTNMGISGIPSGITGQIIGTGVENGISYFDLRLFGTFNTTSGFNIRLETLNGISAANGQTWTLSHYIARLSGTSFGVIRYQVVMCDGANNDIGNVFAGSTNISTDLTSAMRVFGGTVTLNQAATAFISPRLELGHAAGTTIDVVLRFGFSQIEQNSTRTSFMLPPVGAPAAAIRTADTIPLTAAARAGLLSGAGAVAARAVYPVTAVAGGRIVSLAANALIGPTAPMNLAGMFNGTTGLDGITGGGNWNASNGAGACATWGVSGRRIAMNGGTVASDALAVGAGSTVHIGPNTGLQAGQIIRLRQLVGWTLSDRASAAAVQAQARIA